MSRLRRALLLCMAGMLLGSCSIFKEDVASGQSVYLPAINPVPDEDMEEERELTLYFPMADGQYMCSQKRTVFVSATKSVEEVLLDELLNKGPGPNTDLEQVVGSNVNYSMERNGSTIEITLSNFLNRDVLLETASYKLKRELSLYCIVNTLTQYQRSLRVQFLLDDNGTAKQPTYDEMGIAPPPDKTGADKLEVLAEKNDRVLTPRVAMDNILSATRSYDASTLYRYLLSDGLALDEKQLSDTMMKSPKIVDYDVEDYTDDETTSRVKVWIVLRYQDTEEKKYTDIPLKKEGDIWKVAYADLELLIFKDAFVTESTPETLPDNTGGV